MNNTVKVYDNAQGGLLSYVDGAADLGESGYQSGPHNLHRVNWCKRVPCWGDVAGTMS